MLACKKKMKNQFVDAYQITLKPEENERIHVHDFYEVILCLKGEMLCQVEDKQYEMREGDLISVYPGEMHQMQVQEKSICEFYMLHVKLDWTRKVEMISPDIRMRYNKKGNTFWFIHMECDMRKWKRYSKESARKRKNRALAGKT